MRLLTTCALVVLSAVIGGYAVNTGHGPELAVVVIAALPVMLRWVNLFEYVVLTSPFMFYVSIGGPLHAAVSDAVVPVLALAVLAQPELAEVQRAGIRRVVAFSFVATTAAVASGAFAALTPRGFVFSVGVSNLVKLVIVLGYTCVVTAAVATMPVAKTFRALRLWGWVAAALGLGSILTAFAGIPLIPSSGVRSYGFFQDPNLYAGYLLVSLAVVIARECYKGMPETPFLLIALTGAVVATASRSAVGTLAAMLFISALLISARRVRWTLVTLGGVGLWVLAGVLAAKPDLLALPALSRLTTASQTTGTDPRLGLWARAIELWHSSPITGIGIGQYQLYSQDVYGVSASTGNGFIAHNTFLSFLSETGIVGLGILLVGLVAIGRSAMPLKTMGRRLDKAMLIGILAIVGQMMTLNLQNVRYVWILFGVILGLRIREQIRQSELSDAAATAIVQPLPRTPERVRPSASVSQSVR